MSEPRPVAALTGASGFLGAHLVRALDAAGFAVRVLARRAPSAPGWGEVEPEVVAGDLSDGAALSRLVCGAAVVVHAAGAIKAPDLAGFMAVNRDGTARLAEAMAELAPDAHMVLVSSLAAREPQLSAYAASKHAGEEAALAVLGARVSVARPPAIYGPGDRETFALFQAASALPALPVLSETARLALIHVEDAAAAVAAMARAPTPGTWSLADAKAGYGWREIMGEAARAVGRRPRLVHAPRWLLPAAVRVGGLVGAVSGRPPSLSADKAAEILHENWSVLDEERAPGRPRPSWGLAEGFADTVSWYRQAGWMR